jgi:hypothetical protein
MQSPTAFTPQVKIGSTGNYIPRKEDRMRKVFRQRLNLVGKIATFWRILVPFLVVMLIIPAVASAGKDVTYEGTLRGANCVHFKQDCPDDEMHIAMEHDFVLLLPNGDHYFLTNLGRVTKARYANKEVRISGEIENHEIWVDKVEVKESGKYRKVWSWKEQQELYKGGGG